MSIAISLKNKFVYIHVPRTAGTSIHSNLHYMCEIYSAKDGVLAPIHDMENRKHYRRIRAMGTGHTRYCDLESLIGRPWCDSMWFFAFVRNPWDKMVSSYHYDCVHQPNRFNQSTTFDEYVDSQFRWWREVPDEQLLYGQHDYLVDCAGRMPPNMTIYRYEDMFDAWPEIAEKTGSEMTTIGLANGSGRSKSYSEYYDDRTRNAVANAFAKDIEMFGYEFSDKDVLMTKFYEKEILPNYEQG